jgi:hypothetical protein
MVLVSDHTADIREHCVTPNSEQCPRLVLLPGFQKGRDIRLLEEKGREQFWPKKGQFASYKEKRTEFHSF